VIVAKARSQFVCQQCSYSQTGWAGKCPNCGEWGSLVETTIQQTSSPKSTKTIYQKAGTKKPISLSSVKRSSTKRISTKISELDRVLGGGVVPGQVILVAGEPGIGKSTILLQVADHFAKSKASFLYISGEESAQQIKVRADRLGIRNSKVKVMEETNLNRILEDPALQGSTFKGVVVDSIQTMQTSGLTGMVGSVGQVRECAYQLVRFAKQSGIPVFVVGHVTKAGSVAGPAVLAHLVDTVLWFEGDKLLSLRLLRAVKNRFGPTDEVGIFSMKDKGLISLGNPSKLFLSRARKAVSGSAVASIMQGTRPILVEIQSLIIPTKSSFPKRIAQGIDSRKLEILLAVLSRRVGIPLYDYDCFINVVGGISVKNDPAIDLAICLSIASSFYDKPINRSTVIVGEVGLLGEIREVNQQDSRVREAKRIGFTKTVTSKEFKYLNQAVKTLLK